MHHNVEIIVSETPADLARAAATAFRDMAEEAAVAYRSMSVALSGGSTPKALYQALASEEFHSAIQWPLLQIFWGDERFVGTDDENSNYKLAWDHLLSKVPLPEGNIHRVPTEVKDAEAAAKEYELALTSYFALEPGQAPAFDLIMLGLGDDGHTASLFPGKPALDVTERLVTDSPPGRLPPPVDRVTFTFPAINAAKNVFFLVAGEGKAEVIAQILGDAPGGEDYPARRVQPENGRVVWFLDRAAASKLPDNLK